MTSFRVTLLTAAVIILAVIAATNYAVDPYNIRGSESPRLQLFDSLYLTKAWQLRGAKPELLILGSSRVGNAFSGKFDVWREQKVYNSGFPAATLADLELALIAAQRQGGLRRILVAMDFYMFLEMSSDVATEAREQLYQRLAAPDKSMPLMLRALEDGAQVLLQWQALRDSWRTVAACRDLDSGQYPGLVLHEDGQWTATGHRQNGAKADFLESLRLGAGLYCVAAAAPGRDNPLDFSAAERLLQRLYDTGLKVDLVMLPMHASLLQVIDACGLQTARGQWKQGLVKLNQSLAAQRGTEPLLLWDFSSYNAMSTEALPTAELGQRWLIDPSHPSEAAGQHIAEAIMGVDSESDLLLNVASVGPAWQQELAAGRRYATVMEPEVQRLKARLLSKRAQAE